MKLPELTKDEKLIEIEITGRAPGCLMHNVKSMMVEVSGTRPHECVHGVRYEKPCKVGLESCTYRTDDGAGGGSGIADMKDPLPDGVSYCIPSVVLYSCLLLGAKGTDVKIGKRRTQLSYVLPGALRVEPASILLLNPGTGKPIREYEVRADHVVVNRSRVLRFRPWFREWKAHLYMTLAPSGSAVIDPALLQQALSDSGIRIGIFDWRPPKKGPFGTFTVTKFEEVV